MENLVQPIMLGPDPNLPLLTVGQNPHCPSLILDNNPSQPPGTGRRGAPGPWQQCPNSCTGHSLRQLELPMARGYQAPGKRTLFAPQGP